MTNFDRTVRFILAAALGLAVVLAPAAADADSAVPLEKQDATVVGVAAGSEAASTAASAGPQQKTKKKKKAPAMVAVPLEAAQGSAAAPAAAAAGSDAAPPAAAPAAAAAGSDAAPPAAAETPAQPKRRLGMWTTSSQKAATAPSGETPVVVRKDIVGVVPPTGRISGRVLGKDGITLLAGAELILDHHVFGSEHRFVTDSSGAFDLDLPIGQYDLTIQRRHEIYESPSNYNIARRSTLPIDFILLRDFEGQPAAAAAGATGRNSASGGDAAGRALDDGADRWLPDPRQEPEVVGSVVDLVSAEQDAPDRSRRNGAETLGFLGALLVVLIAL